MPAIDGDRLLRDLYAAREIGKYKTGVHRPTFSSEDIAARTWFAEQCVAAGLETTIVEPGVIGHLTPGHYVSVSALTGPPTPRVEQTVETLRGAGINASVDLSYWNGQLSDLGPWNLGAWVVAAAKLPLEAWIKAPK